MAILFLISFLTMFFSNVPCWGLAANSTYWNELFPKTEMPTAITTALPLHTNSTRTAEWVSSDEVVIQDYGSGGKCKVDPGMHSVLRSRFVLIKNLRIGSQITVQLKPYFPITTTFPVEEDLPPFSTQKFFENLAYFNISSNSKAAYVMNLTLHKCEEKKAINGKWQYCANSLKNLLRFANETLGLKGLQAVSPPSASTEGLSHYQVASVKPLGTEGKTLLCHRYGFPYAVFYCHQPTATRAFAVQLVTKNGENLASLVTCHYQTSGWNPNYFGFQALGVKPGTPICHFLHFQDLIWYWK